MYKSQPPRRALAVPSQPQRASHAWDQDRALCIRGRSYRAAAPAPLPHERLAPDSSGLARSGSSPEAAASPSPGRPPAPWGQMRALEQQYAAWSERPRSPSPAGRRRSPPPPDPGPETASSSAEPPTRRPIVSLSPERRPTPVAPISAPVARGYNVMERLPSEGRGSRSGRLPPIAAVAGWTEGIDSPRDPEVATHAAARPAEPAKEEEKEEEEEVSVVTLRPQPPAPGSSSMRTPWLVNAASSRGAESSRDQEAAVTTQQQASLSSAAGSNSLAAWMPSRSDEVRQQQPLGVGSQGQAEARGPAPSIEDVLAQAQAVIRGLANRDGRSARLSRRPSASPKAVADPGHQPPRPSAAAASSPKAAPVAMSRSRSSGTGGDQREPPINRGMALDLEVEALENKRRELERLHAELEARVGEIRSQQKKRRGAPVSASSPAAASGPSTRPHPDPSLSGAAASGGLGIEDVENHIRLKLAELARLTDDAAELLPLQQQQRNPTSPSPMAGRHPYASVDEDIVSNGRKRGMQQGREEERGREGAESAEHLQIRAVVSAAKRRNGGLVARAGQRDGAGEGGRRQQQDFPQCPSRAEVQEEVEEMIERRIKGLQQPARA